MLLATSSKNIIRRKSPISVSVVIEFTSNERSYVFYNTSINIRREVSSLKLVSNAVSYFSSILKVKVLANCNSLNRPASCGVTYRSSNYVSKSIHLYCRSFTLVGVATNLGISKRFMHRSKHIASKNTFHLLDRLLDPSLLNQITAKDHLAFLSTVYDHCFNPNEGSLQHKYTLLHSIFRQKYDSSFYAKHYTSRFPDTKVSFIPNIATDFRVLGELPVVRHYENTFKEDIEKIVLTSDSISTTFNKQKQSNPDIIVYLSSPLGIKKTYQDVKNGMNMSKSATRGSIGLIPFDYNKNIIPFTSQDFALNDITAKNLIHISLGLQSDNIQYKPFFDTLNQGHLILKKESDMFTAHDNVQRLLWKNLQCHSLYKRSIAFTFVEFQSETIIEDKQNIYYKKFVNLLSDRTYDPNKISDRKEIYKAMLIAYRDIDPELSRKINYFVNTTGIEIDPHFLQVLGGLIRDTLI